MFVISQLCVGVKSPCFPTDQVLPFTMDIVRCTSSIEVDLYFRSNRFIFSTPNRFFFISSYRQRDTYPPFPTALLFLLFWRQRTPSAALIAFPSERLPSHM